MVTIFRRFGGAYRLRSRRQTVQEESLKAQSVQEIPSCIVWPCESSDVVNSLPINTGKHPSTIGSSFGLNVGGVLFKLWSEHYIINSQEPHLMVTEMENRQRQFSGYVWDIWNEIEERMNFT